MRALGIFEARLGADHPHTAHSLHTLAIAKQAQGDLDHARALFSRALVIHEARLGADHPSTLESRKRLAQVQAALESQR